MPPAHVIGEEERLLLALAQRAAVAIANAREYQRAQYTATVDERQRLARDLHDAVTPDTVCSWTEC